MTPFETQVAAALLMEIQRHTEAFFGVRGNPTPGEHYLADHLAPRVAAAIQAGIDAAGADENITGISPNRAALSALRGEP